jgi:hypothetical protein
LGNGRRSTLTGSPRGGFEERLPPITFNPPQAVKTKISDSSLVQLEADAPQKLGRMPYCVNPKGREHCL